MENKLKLIHYIKNYKKSGAKVYPRGLYQCECGNTKELYIHNVKSNNTRSCGCLNEERIKVWNRKRKN